MTPLDIHITAQSIITTAAFLSALGAIIAVLVKVMRFIDAKKAQDAALEEIRNTHATDIHSVREEQALIIYGVLACLKGLREQGCNGPVTKAIERIEKHLNEEAHK